MSTCVCHILRHDFYNLDNRDESVAFLERMIERVMECLRIKDKISAQITYYGDDVIEGDAVIEYAFNIPNYDATISMGRGYWVVSQAFSLDLLFCRFDGNYSVRLDIFDIARALGAKEAWHCSEYLSPEDMNSDETFESWMARMENKFGVIPEFDESAIDEFNQFDQSHYYARIIHDSFRECNIQLHELKERFAGFQVLNLCRIVGRYIKLHTDAGCYLADESTGEFLLDYPVDDVLENLNGAGMIIQKDNLSAFFNSEGRQMSEFVPGKWRWGWENVYRVVYNDEENLSFTI